MTDDKNKHRNLEKHLKKLIEENQRLRDFSELSSDWFWEQDAEYRFTGFSGIRPEMLRRQQNEFFGKKRWEMPISGVSPGALQAHIRCYDKRQPFYDFEYDVIGSNGSIQRYSVSGTPIFNDAGEFSGYRGVGKNITALYRAQEALKNSERTLQQILQGNPIPIFVINAHHEVTHWNLACEKLTGIPANEIIGSQDSWRGFYSAHRPTMADLVVSGANAEGIRKHYGTKFKSSSLINGAYEAEDFFPDIGESGYWLHFNASPITSPDGLVIGAIETLQDISARKQAEEAEAKHFAALKENHEELQSTVEQLVEAKKLAGLGRLVSGVAHELNTPLGNCVMGLSSLDALHDELRDKYQSQKLSQSFFDDYLSHGEEALEHIENNLKRCTQLISRFRELASDQSQYDIAEFCPYEITQHIINLYEQGINQLNIQVDNQIKPSLQMKGPIEAFEQVVSSLIENCLIHAFKEQGSGTITLAASVEANYYCFTVSDNGSGMDQTTLNHAFDPFFSSRMGQGTSGLGLYRVYNLINAVLGGSISIRQQEDQKGCAVSFTLPIVER